MASASGAPTRGSTTPSQAEAGSNDPMSKVQKQLGDAMDAMKANISRMNDRGEAVESLLGKSDGLAETSTAFNSRSRQLERTMWMKSWKSFVLGILIIAVALTATWFINKTLFWCLLVGVAVVGGIWGYLKWKGRAGGIPGQASMATELFTRTAASAMV